MSKMFLKTIGFIALIICVSHVTPQATIAMRKATNADLEHQQFTQFKIAKRSRGAKYDKPDPLIIQTGLKWTKETDGEWEVDHPPSVEGFNVIHNYISASGNRHGHSFSLFVCKKNPSQHAGKFIKMINSDFQEIGQHLGEKSLACPTCDQEQEEENVRKRATEREARKAKQNVHVPGGKNWSNPLHVMLVAEQQAREETERTRLAAEQKAREDQRTQLKAKQKAREEEDRRIMLVAEQQACEETERIRLAAEQKTKEDQRAQLKAERDAAELKARENQAEVERLSAKLKAFEEEARLKAERDAAELKARENQAEMERLSAKLVERIAFEEEAERVRLAVEQKVREVEAERVKLSNLRLAAIEKQETAHLKKIGDERIAEEEEVRVRLIAEQKSRDKNKGFQ